MTTHPVAGDPASHTLILSHHDVIALLPVEECIGVMADALRTLARGGALLPLRTVVRLPGGQNAFALMPAALDVPPALGAKVITVVPGNDATRYDSHQGAVLLFDLECGRLLAILDASSITAIRTAAVSGVATRLLARAGARELALLGAGVQASTHLAAMLAVRPVERVRVWSPSGTRAIRFAERESGRHGVAIEPAGSAKAAVAGADIICTVTASREPVLHAAWIGAGTHINAVGASLPTARELDSATVARSCFYVDRRESALNEAGDFLVPKREGLVDDTHIRGEIGELLLDPPAAVGRTADDQVTVFKSLGLAIEDLASAHHVYRRAIERGAGTRVYIGGLRDADA